MAIRSDTKPVVTVPEAYEALVKSWLDGSHRMRERLAHQESTGSSPRRAMPRFARGRAGGRNWCGATLIRAADAEELQETACAVAAGHIGDLNGRCSNRFVHPTRPSGSGLLDFSFDKPIRPPRIRQTTRRSIRPMCRIE